MFFAAPFISVFGGMALRGLSMRSQIEPIVMVADVSPHAFGIASGLVAGAVLILFSSTRR